MEMWGNEGLKNFKTLAHLHFKFLTQYIWFSHFTLDGALHIFHAHFIFTKQKHHDLGAYLKNLGEESLFEACWQFSVGANPTRSVHCLMCSAPSTRSA